MRAKQAGQSPLLLLDVVSALKKEGIEYAAIGALAAAVYGTIRASADADALISFSVSQLAKLAQILKKRGFATELRRGDPDDPIPAMLIISDQYDNRVDLLVGLRGLDPSVYPRTVAIPFRGGEQVRFLGREDFIATRCFAGRPQDIEDARVAIRTATESLNLDLLRRITRRFGRAAADVLEQVLDG